MCNSNVQLEERQEGERGGCVASNLGRARGREAERERRAGQRQRGKLLLWESSASAYVDK